MRFFVHSSPAFYGLFTFFCEVRVLLRTQYFERRDVRSILDKTSFCVWLFVLLSLHQSPVDQRIKVNLGEWCWIDSTLLVFTKKRSYTSLSARIFPHSQYCCSITSNLVAKICYFQWKSSNQEEKRLLPVPSSPYSGIRQKYCEFSLCFIWVLTAFSVLTIIHSFSCQTASIFFKPLKPFPFPPSQAKIAAWQCASGRSWIDNDLNILTFILSTLSF